MISFSTVEIARPSNILKQFPIKNDDSEKLKSQLCSSKNHKNLEQIKLNAEKNIKWYKKQSIIQSIDAISYS